MDDNVPRQRQRRQQQQQQQQQQQRKKTKERWLDLSGQRLSLVPTHLTNNGALRNVDFRLTTKLSLRANRFTSIPQAFSALSVLRELDLSENLIEDLAQLSSIKSTTLTKLR
jgi:hypothetical protein